MEFQEKNTDHSILNNNHSSKYKWMGIILSSIRAEFNNIIITYYIYCFYKNNNYKKTKTFKTLTGIEPGTPWSQGKAQPAELPT